MMNSSLLPFSSRQTPCAGSPSDECFDATAFADLRCRYTSVLKANLAEHCVVWLGASPTQAPWSDWAHQIVLQVGRRRADPDLVKAWIHAATTALPDARWLVWQEIVEVLAQTSSPPVLQAFLPPLLGLSAARRRIERERVVFLGAWARLLDYTLHEVQPARPASTPSISVAVAPDTSEVDGVVKRNEKANVYIAELASVLQEHNVRRDNARRLATAYLACGPATPLDPDLEEHILNQAVAPAPPFYLRQQPIANECGYPVTPSDADERGRWSLRLAFLRLFATLAPTSVIKMCKSKSGFRDLYAWQGIAGAESVERHPFIESCLHSQMPHEPVEPRFI